MASLPTCAVVTYNPTVIGRDEPLRAAVAEMAESDGFALPVVDADRSFLGLATSSAIAERLDADRDAGPDRKVGDVELAGTSLYSVDDSPWPPLTAMLRDGLSLAAVGADRRLEGVMTRRDYLREFADQWAVAGSTPVIEQMADLHELVEATRAVDEVVRSYRATPNSVIPIVHGGVPLGAVIARDLAARHDLARCESILGLRNRPTLSLLHSLASCGHAQPGESLADAARRMVEADATALLVVNKAGRLMGSLSADQLLEFLVAHRHGR